VDGSLEDVYFATLSSVAARPDMLTSIAKFEIRYQLKSPVFWITSAVFFWFAFSLINSDEIQFGWGGYVVRNSPYTTALTVMVLTVFAVFIATTFAASVVLRDDETGFGRSSGPRRSRRPTICLADSPAASSSAAWCT
jgi:hypothetical protein